MTARSEVTTLAKTLGVQPELATLRPAGIDIVVEAPDGKVWSATDTHEIVARSFTDKESAWVALRDDMTKGVVDCDDSDCEWCER